MNLSLQALNWLVIVDQFTIYSNLFYLKFLFRILTTWLFYLFILLLLKLCLIFYILVDILSFNSFFVLLWLFNFISHHRFFCRFISFIFYNGLRLTLAVTFLLLLSFIFGDLWILCHLVVGWILTRGWDSKLFVKNFSSLL